MKNRTRAKTPSLPPLWWTYYSLTLASLVLTIYFASINPFGMVVGSMIFMYFAYYWARLMGPNRVPKPPFADLVKILDLIVRTYMGRPRGGGQVGPETALA